MTRLSYVDRHQRNVYSAHSLVLLHLLVPACQPPPWLADQLKPPYLHHFLQVRPLLTESDARDHVDAMIHCRLEHLLVKSSHRREDAQATHSMAIWARDAIVLSLSCEVEEVAEVQVILMRRQEKRIDELLQQSLLSSDLRAAVMALEEIVQLNIEKRCCCGIY